MAADLDVLPWWGDLALHGERHAIGEQATGEALTYTALAERVDARASVLRDRLVTTSEISQQRLVVELVAESTVATVVDYLAIQAAGHVVAVSARRGEAALAGWTLQPGGAVELLDPALSAPPAIHPALAVLLGTSGSTGSAKWVKLSGANLRSNAEAIATYLSLTAHDRALLTLPLHYCYGLSVLHSHLVAGAGIWLDSRSATEPALWQTAADHGVTGFAGVPHTYDLLNLTDFTDLEFSSLRYLTQAGGRMHPERVRDLALFGQARGVDLFVMYGQTEATARMSYLPPELAASAPETIGVPIPGGEFALAPTGELLYRGDNVMGGYAVAHADLAAMDPPAWLATGDLARQRDDGLWQITGRLKRIAKIYGLRIDLDHTETRLAEAGVIAAVVEAGDVLVVGSDASARAVAHDVLVDAVASVTGLPPHRIRVAAALPRLANGKVDYQGLARNGDGACSPSEKPLNPRRDTQAAMLAAFAEVLRRPATPSDSFVGLRGDSLVYVEIAARLEAILGWLPPSWPQQSIADLAAQRRHRGQRASTRWAALRTLESNVALRACAIVLVVGSHAGLFSLVGGAHLLLGICGYNFGRFTVPLIASAQRARAAGTACWSAIKRVAIPTIVWCAIAATFDSQIVWQNLLLVNSWLGSATFDPSWRYWFVESLVLLLVAGMALGIGPIRRTLVRQPFWLPVALTMCLLLTRYELVWLPEGDRMHRGVVVAWIFTLGWACYEARRPSQKALISLLALATIPGFFENPSRETVIVSGLIALIWTSTLRLPAFLHAVASLLASASLWIYLVHWQIYPPLEDAGYPLLATLASLAAGVACWRLGIVERLSGLGSWRWNVDGSQRRAPSPSRSPEARVVAQPSPVAAPASGGDDQPAYLPPGSARSGRRRWDERLRVGVGQALGGARPRRRDLHTSDDVEVATYR